MCNRPSTAFGPMPYPVLQGMYPHLLRAVDAATPGPIEEGSVGGGTGMNRHEFEGGTAIAEHFSASGAGSVIAIVATDAPLLPNQCEALARRVTLGLARTGTSGSHFSGDLFLGVSTGNPGAFTPGALTLFGKGRPYDDLRFVAWGWMDPF